MASIVVAEIPCDVPLSRSSILSEARDVYNHGSTLNSVAGDIHYHNYSAHKGHGLLGSGTVASTQSELPSQLYSRLLMREGRGYPLFDATLPNELPEEYQLSGAMIGDVGIVTPDGYFDVLFNICEPADGPINGGCVPDGFITLERPPRNRHNYRKGRSSDLGTWVASDAVEVTPHQTFSGRYPITCGPGEGSILVLPEGAVREDLLRREGFLEYASKHGVSWYAFANTHLGRGVANGAMYLITGFDKANSWGTASFFSSDITPRFRMCFSEGSWVDPGRASTRKGPGGMCNSFENQCLFLRGYKVTLNSRGLTSIFGIKVVETSPLGGLAQDPIRQNDSTPFPSVVGLLSIWRSIAGSDEVGMNPEVTATEPELSLDIHPSNLINTYLLSKERRGGTQDYKSLLDYVDHKYVVHKEGSAVYFDDKSYQERLNMEYTVTSEVYPQPTATGKMLDGEEGTDQPASILRACTNCQATKSTLWRRDPAGKLLCNSCGSFFRLHGVARPLSRRTDVIKKRNRASGSSSDSLRKGSGNKSRPRSKSNPNGSVTGGGDFAPAARGLTTIARNAASGVASTGIPATKRQRRTSIASTATPTNN